MSEEHLFRKSWKEKIVTSDIPLNSPAFTREFSRVLHDGSVQSVKPEMLFEVVVKWVCNDCNNSWMNRLDDAVEPWILNPYEDQFKPDPDQFRLWAIKMAVLRSYYDSPLLPQPEDIRAVYDREDVAAWRIFVGQMAEPNHTHTQVGFGPVNPLGGGRFDGITQITWSLGRVVIIALRIVGTMDSTWNYLNKFRHHNISEGVVVAEVVPGANKFPSIALLPRIAWRGYMSLAWFFSTHPLSPVAAEMAAIQAAFERAARDQGFTPLRM